LWETYIVHVDTLVTHNTYIILSIFSCIYASLSLSLSSLSVNQFYPLLDEVGSWKGSSDQLCDSIHSLAAQADCVSATAANQARPECQKGEREREREREEERE
jgi:hypothetical protein